MSKNILILSGSPRKDGNTDLLAEAFAQGARSAGKDVTIFRTADMNIGGCRGCEYCFSHNSTCIQNDDMGKIIEAIRKSDALVIASPVYYFFLTGQIKLAIDRFYAMYQEGMPIKRYALLMTCGDKEYVAKPSIDMLNMAGGLLKWEHAGTIIAPGLHDAGEIKGRKELDEAKLLGEKI